MDPQQVFCPNSLCKARGHVGKGNVNVLPEEAALALLLRDPARQAVLAPGHPEHEVARRICNMLGRLPLALEIAGAFLSLWPDVDLVGLAEQLKAEGCLAVLDSG